MSYEEFQDLYQRCTSGNCTTEDELLFEEYKDSFNLSDIPWLPEFGNKAEIERSLKNNLNKRLKKGVVLPFNWRRWAAAAAVLTIALSAAFFAAKYFRGSYPSLYQNAGDKNLIKPGSDKAVLTLSDGSRYTLDKAHRGEIFTRGHISVENNVNGSISYHRKAPAKPGSDQIYNEVSTPRGGKYQLILADGTKVWLNAASTIRYPLDFTGQSREVELNGEAYFEVAHDAKRPFKVSSAGQIVQVLGTHFNINAYQDNEATRTTLLQGLVRVAQKSRSSGAASLIILPNEQAVFKDRQLSKINVDADAFTAWTSGRMVFKDADIHEVMQKISRWYDVDIIYDGKFSKDTYNGEIPQNAAFSKVLQMLKLDDIHVKVSGRKLIISQ